MVKTTSDEAIRILESLACIANGKKKNRRYVYSDEDICDAIYMGIEALREKEEKIDDRDHKN